VTSVHNHDLVDAEVSLAVRAYLGRYLKFLNATTQTTMHPNAQVLYMFRLVSPMCSYASENKAVNELLHPKKNTAPSIPVAHVSDISVVAVHTVHTVRLRRSLQLLAVKLTAAPSQALCSLLGGNITLRFRQHLIPDLELADRSAAE
jgi:hypothetical protein